MTIKTSNLFGHANIPLLQAGGNYPNKLTTILHTDLLLSGENRMEGGITCFILGEWRSMTDKGGKGKDNRQNNT